MKLDFFFATISLKCWLFKFGKHTLKTSLSVLHCPMKYKMTLNNILILLSEKQGFPTLYANGKCILATNEVFIYVTKEVSITDGKISNDWQLTMTNELKISYNLCQSYIMIFHSFLELTAVEYEQVCMEQRRILAWVTWGRGRKGAHLSNASF